MGNTETRVIRTTKKVKIGGASKKGRQSAHNQQTGKYVRQRKRTEARKERRRDEK